MVLLSQPATDLRAAAHLGELLEQVQDGVDGLANKRVA
jgi:hypothetical protein